MPTISEIRQSHKSALEYDHSGRAWLVGHPTGQIISFPAGPAGKQAAMLSALTHDRPDVAAEVDALLQAWPNNPALHSRLLKAGFILRDGQIVDRYPKNIFAVSSQTDSLIYSVYLPWAGDGENMMLNAGCQCEDHQNAHLHNKPGAPWLPGLGWACKHMLAAWIFAKLNPVAVCPECHGSGHAGQYRDDVGRRITEACDLCDGTGEVPQEWVEPLLGDNLPLPDGVIEVRIARSLAEAEAVLDDIAHSEALF